MNVLKSLASKEYWIHIAVIIGAIMLFEQTLSNFILNYIQLNALILGFFSKALILIITDLILHTVLELQ